MVTRKLDNVADVYVLSPMQEGMLYHSIAEPGSGVYVNQVVSSPLSSLAPEGFVSAWRALVERHGALRTAFVWDGLDRPLQLVREQAKPELERFDWASKSSEAQEHLLDEYLAGDRARGFDLGEAPLMRLAIIGLGDGRWQWVWTFHHLIIDGWSAQILLDELSQLCDGAEPHDLGPTVPFADLIAWQRSRDRVKEEEFWKANLAGLSEPFRLEVPGLPPDEDATGHCSETITIDEPTTGRIRRMAVEEGLTLNAVMSAAWSVVLSRWANSRDVVFGVTNSGRPDDLEGSERGVGLYINTLPMRLDVDRELPVTKLMKTTQNQHVAMLAHQHTSLSNVQHWSDVEEGSLFESVYVFENYPARSPSGAIGLDALRHIEQSNYPLAVLVVPGDAITLHLIHDSSVLSHEAARSLGEQIRTAAEWMATHPNGTVGEIEVVSVADRHRVTTWGRGRELPTPTVMAHRQIARWAETHPERPAVDFGALSMTYLELNQAANAVATRLQAEGAGPDAPIGLLVRRSPEMIIGILGILKAGAAYVPLDPDYPAEHIRTILSDEIEMVLADPTLTDLLPDGVDVVTLPDSAELSDSEPEDEAGPENLAYIIHTSGSTGSPKGVQVTHANLAYSTAARSVYYASPPQRFLLLSSFSFDSSIVGIFWTLCAGGTLILPPSGLERDLDGILELADGKQVTHLLCLPALYELLIEQGGDSLADLRVAIVAGEACPPSLVAGHLATLPGTELHNEYGPTEASVWCAVHRVTPDDQRGPVPIGKPIPGAQLSITDESGRLVPAGFAGELRVGGPGVTLGYLGRPEETAKNFIHSEEGDRGELAYRTGDLTAFRSDGNLLFLGRADSQVKVRGHRVEIASVTAALRSCTRVDDAAVTTEPSVQGTGHRLVAFVVGEGLIPDETKEQMSRMVPEFMVPDEIAVIESIPRLPNGKIDTERLPKASAANERAGRNHLTLPHNETESVLAEIWTELLGLDQIGVHESFFRLGGDSILAIRMVSKARSEGIDVEPSDPASHATIAAIAAAVAARQADEGSLECLVPINTEGNRTPLVCIHAAGGNVLPFRVLSDHLGPDQPVYAFTARGVDGSKPPRDSIPEMASSYIEELRQVLPRGPYRLLGDCLGGCIAHEMTAQLEQMGETVEDLIIVDGALPLDDSRAVTNLEKARRAIRTDGFSGLLKGVARLARRRTTQIRDSFGDEEDRFRAYRQKVINASLVAFGRFQPKRIDSTVLLIRADDDLRDSDGMYWHTDWGSYAARVDVIVLDTDHSSILREPAVSEVSEVLTGPR